MKFSCSPLPEGARIELEHRGLLGKKVIPFPEWQAKAGHLSPTIRFIEHALADGEITQEGSRIQVSSEWILSLPASQIEALNIPPLAGLSVGVSMRGRIDSDDSILQLVWQDQNLRVISPEITGPFIRVAGEWRRLSPALHALNNAAKSFNQSAGTSFETRLPFWQAVQEILQHTLGHEIKADRFVGTLTIYQAGAFALDIRETAHGPDFVPILMARGEPPELGEIDDTADAPETDGQISAEWTGDGKRKDNESDALLTPLLQSRFTDEVSNRPGDAKPAYVLDRNTYLLVDPALRTALDVVKRVRGSSDVERKAFLKNPRTLIAESLGDDGDAIVASLFVETQQYSDRIEGLGLWEKPKLPWVTRKSNQWLPERFTVQIGAKRLDATPEKIEELQFLCAKAESDLTDDIAFDNELFATADVRSMLDRLEVHGPEDKTDPPSGEGSERPERDQDVLQIKQNLEELDYASKLVKRGHFLPFEFPKGHINQTVPKEHQLQGFGWLCECWKQGWPGVLLADDMGLGKTFQALAFLAWIKANQTARKGYYRPLQGPILIVAPTALLDNWKKEADIHLRPDTLGSRVDAFGRDLKHLKTAKRAGWTEEDALDVEQLRHADWILTTYETLALYHRSFARVAYSVAIFDEMQKVKSPDSINSHAAKTMNIDFVLGMTGTPIENRLEDLWCLMDRIAPGYLGDLKSFSKTYGAEEPQALKELKRKMDQPQGNAPAIMLRRMKDDVAKDLPRKEIRTYPVKMPGVQAAAYEEAVAAAKATKVTPRSMLETLHLLRGISLHPQRSSETNAYDPEWRQNWITGSARLQKTFAILEDIQSRSEKALVFLEDRSMQKIFASSVAEHFRLHFKPPIINGEMTGRQRLQAVDDFQTRPLGFDLLILSPKAAGIGLTITAANHVVHLSRWWNPAVEDQCNDRAFRIGQKKDVTIHLPMAIHPTYGDASFDYKLHSLLERKRTLSRDMLAPPTSAGDIDDLFAGTVQQES
ncbi:DEAD/DEAH box helicase [Hoeflea sp.]|uniref:DEAD/DEAH box helicase n=1 Tax=Hoeflea sp. TaxID=1940281 RepID=UPI003A8EF5E6